MILYIESVTHSSKRYEEDVPSHDPSKERFIRKCVEDYLRTECREDILEPIPKQIGLWIRMDNEETPHQFLIQPIVSVNWTFGSYTSPDNTFDGDLI